MKVDIQYSVQRGLLSSRILFTPATAENTLEGQIFKQLHGDVLRNFGKFLAAPGLVIPNFGLVQDKAVEAVEVLEVPATEVDHIVPVRVLSPDIEVPADKPAEETTPAEVIEQPAFSEPVAPEVAAVETAQEVAPEVAPEVAAVEEKPKSAGKRKGSATSL